MLSLPSAVRIFMLYSALAGLPLPALTSIEPAQAATRDYFQTHPIEFPNRISAYQGVTYSTQVGYRPLRLDIYGDRKAASPRPLILFVHGGAWENGSRQASGKFEDSTSILAGLAARGFVVASVEHRLNGEAPFPAPYHVPNRDSSVSRSTC